MAAKNNPYIVPGEPPRTRNSVVAVLDVLGFAETMRAAYRNESSPKLLAELRSAMDDAYKNFEERKWNNEIRTSWYVKAFTDNIVIGHPVVFSDAEGELGSVLLALREYQIEIVIAGFFVRGGVGIGELYMDDEIVFGDALLEAHEAEQSIARDPRTVMAKSAQSYITQQFRFYGDPTEAPQNQVLLRNVDDQLFVNYLGAAFDEDPQRPMFGRIERHRLTVERKLEEFRSQPPIWSKYAWVAGYHNFICQEQGREFRNYRIDTKLLRQRPTFR